MKNQSIQGYYSNDHQRLEALLHQFQSSKGVDPKNARKAFQQFKAGLERHILWEEEILFPVFEEAMGGHQCGPTVVMRMEHEQIKQCLEAIKSKLAGQDFATETEEANLQSILHQHNQKEEGILYPMIDQTVDNQQRTEIFSKMEKVTA